MRDIPEEVHNEAYDWADQFSDWYGCDSVKRERLTKAFEDAIMEDRTRRNKRANRDVDRRANFITDCLLFEGRLNRRDICEAFGVSVPQASIDIRSWLKHNPGRASYNRRRKCYELAA